MAIKTSYRTFPLLRNAAFAIFCIVGGIWGAYDYWVRYPRIERDGQEFEAAAAELQKLGEKAKAAATAPPPLVAADPNQRPTLSAEELKAFLAAKATIDRLTAQYGSKPPALAAWDRPVQLWLWVVGCGILGTPFFLWPIYQMLTRHWTLDDDGTLHAPEGTFTADQIVDIDMSRWCSPTGNKRSTWKAWLKTADGKRLELDDQPNKDMDLIIGTYAHRFYPDQWTVKARRVGEKSEEPAADAPAAASS